MEGKKRKAKASLYVSTNRPIVDLSCSGKSWSQDLSLSRCSFVCSLISFFLKDWRYFIAILTKWSTVFPVFTALNVHYFSWTSYKYLLIIILFIFLDGIFTPLYVLSSLIAMINIPEWPHDQASHSSSSHLSRIRGRLIRSLATCL